MRGNTRCEALTVVLVKVQVLRNVTVFVGGGGVAVDALKDPSAFIFRVQNEHEGTRMLTASHPRRIESSGTDTHFSNDC